MKNKIRKAIREHMKPLDNEGRMAKSQMYKMQGYINKLSQMLDDGIQLPAWVQSKFTKASDYMSAVFHYLEYEIARDTNNIEEDHTDAENKKLKKISKQLKKSVKSHDKQAKTIDKITKESNDPEDDAEQAEYDKGWYGESLKETASKLGYLNEEKNCGCGKNPCETYGTMNEEVDEQGLDQIEMGLNQITGGGRQSASVSDRGDKIRIKFSYMREEFDGETWEAILEYLSDNMGYKILDASNYYERNWEPEEPAEAVPMIYLQK